MIDMYPKYDNTHKSIMFYALIFINNRIMLCYQYILNIPICEIFEKDIDYLERITLSDMTHMMSMADLVAIYVETLMIDSEFSLEIEFTGLICMNP